MKRAINTVLSVIVLLLFLPTTLAIASWNSLPGSRLFTVKLTMEQALVSVTPSAKIKGDLQIHYTERRFSEAQALLAADQTSARGLVFLDNQVGATKQQILASSDTVVKRDLAKKYVETLQNVSTQLEEQKQIAVVHASEQATRTLIRPTPTIIVQTTVTVAHTPTSIPIQTPTMSPTNTPTSMPTNTPPPPVPQRTSVQPPAQENIVASITASQEEIHQTIEEMQQIFNEPADGSRDTNDKRENKELHGNSNKERD